MSLCRVRETNEEFECDGFGPGAQLDASAAARNLSKSNDKIYTVEKLHPHYNVWNICAKYKNGRLLWDARIVEATRRIK